jgi:ATP/maltotriose-dependent transcriptional regulator MalT
MTQGDLPSAQAVGLESLRVFRAIDQRHGVADALSTLAMVAFARGKVRTAANMHERSLRLYRETGDAYMEHYSLSGLADVALAEGDDALAEQLSREANDYFARTGERLAAARGRQFLALVAIHRHEYAEAEQLATEALAEAHGLHAKEDVCGALDLSAATAALTGRFERAVILLAAADSLRASAAYRLTYPLLAELHAQTLATAREQLAPTTSRPP